MMKMRAGITLSVGSFLQRMIMRRNGFNVIWMPFSLSSNLTHVFTGANVRFIAQAEKNGLGTCPIAGCDAFEKVATRVLEEENTEGFSLSSMRPGS